MSSTSDYYSQIEDKLYLGMQEVAVSEEYIKKLGIQRILTLREYPLAEDQKLPNIDYYHVGLHDTPDDDLLSHFPECHKFLDEGAAKGQTIYVHCRMGVSRSATVVISWLMVKYKLSAEEALKKVQKKRSQVRPNPSFMFQLKLWGEMKYSFDPKNIDFRLHLLKRWVFLMKQKIVSNTNNPDPDQSILDSFFTILKLEPDQEGKAYSCKNCNSVLFREIHIVRDNSLDSPRYQCPNLVVEPRKWMIEQISSNAVGDIKCHKCENKVGDFNWRQFFCECILHQNLKAYQVLKFVVNDLKTE